MRWRWIIFAPILITMLVAGCGMSGRKISVSWRVVKGNPGVVSVEVDGTRHAYQSSTVDGSWVEVEARLHGADRTKPFEFEVSGDVDEYAWDRLSDTSIRIHPTHAGRGVVTVWYEDLAVLVPFIVHPVVVLTSDTNLVDPIEANAYSFAAGQRRDPQEGDLYIDMSSGRKFYAPYGYAVENLEDFWGALRDPRDVRSLAFSDPNAEFEPSLGKLYVVKTADGGYAQFFISATRFEPARYNLIYRYSPDGIFE